jgi:hypothetical protein
MVGYRGNDNGRRSIHAFWRGHRKRNGDFGTGRNEIWQRYIDRDCSGKHHHVRLRELQSSVYSAFTDFYLHSECFRNRKL